MFWFALLVPLAVTLLGCQTPVDHFARIVNEPQPVSAEVRESFGVMGVLPAQPVAPFDFRYPAGVGASMAVIGTESFVAMADSALHFEDADLGGKLEAVAFSAALATAAGVVGGLFAGVPEGDVRRAQTAIERALEENSIEPRVSAHLYEIAALGRSTNLVAISEAAVAEFSSGGCTNRDVSAFVDAGVDSVLILRVIEEGFAAEPTLNPPMAVDIKLEIQVVRVLDGQDLFVDVLQYRGERRRFTQWGAKQARLFRRELDAAQATFAAVIFDELVGVEFIVPAD